MQMQVPFGVAQGRLSTSLRFAQKDGIFEGAIERAQSIFDGSVYGRD